MLEGYGLTETTAAVTVNRPGLVRVGSVGQPLPGTTVRVADDGELLVRGGQVMSGYWENAEATREVLSADGWFHTGDLGAIDDEGFVWITGRQKELLVTAGGKNVAPAPLEERIRAHPLVSQCLVLGDGRPFVSALVTLDAAAVSAVGRGARQAGRPGCRWPMIPTYAARSSPPSTQPTRPSRRRSPCAGSPCSPVTGVKRVASSPPASRSGAARCCTTHRRVVEDHVRPLSDTRHFDHFRDATPSL